MAVALMNENKAVAFEEKMVAILNHGALANMISIGHRAELFDTMQELPPSTSAEIAEAAGKDERYVREWLGALVVGGVIEYHPATKTYFLPREHAACLTRDAAPNNLAALAQYIPQLGAVEDEIVECFERGGGVPYSSFRRFHEIMADDSGQSVLPALMDHILPLIPGVKERLQAGIDVVDIGCGVGKALNLLAQHFPNSRFTGYEFSDEAIDKATAEARAIGNRNIEFLFQDAAEIADVEAFDLVFTFDAIHDQADPARVLRNIHRALRPGGWYLMQDIKAHTHLHENLDHPIGPLLYTVSCMHCMTVSLAQGGLGLGTMWGRELAEQMLAEAGFTELAVHELAHDIQNLYFVMQK
ncbi:MAG: class I SAM-dependent methyltransferase [Candidatus Hydrogenedentes bacterium]|nr:class I SAM-dependent methyltransferase [Candidatus Hydrogenedentota bacterium]